MGDDVRVGRVRGRRHPVGMVAGDRVDDQDLGECGFDDEPR
jgi:hypothetical protein